MIELQVTLAQEWLLVNHICLTCPGSLSALGAQIWATLQENPSRVHCNLCDNEGSSFVMHRPFDVMCLPKQPEVRLQGTASYDKPACWEAEGGWWHRAAPSC